MTRRSIPQYTCDRCGSLEELRNQNQEYNWAKLAAYRINGLNIGSMDKPVDLCLRCWEALYQWWERK